MELLEVDLNFSPAIVGQIRSDLVLTSLSDSILVKSYLDRYFVLFQNCIVPYELFISILFAGCLWNKTGGANNSTDLGYNLIIRKRIETNLSILWKKINLSTKSDEVWGVESPLDTILRKLPKIKVDEDVVKFFNQLEEPQWEAILYLIEREYANEVKVNEKIQN